MQPQPSKIAAIDLVLGLEQDDKHSLSYYKTFTPTMRNTLKQYTSQGGALLVSGAYIGSDMQDPEERQFLANVLKCQYAGRHTDTNSTVTGLGTAIQYWNQLNGEHYAAVSTDVLMPAGSAYIAMQYADGQDAAIAYKGSDYSVFTMGFPFECIKDEKKRSSIMRGLLDYLIK
jgi:hypothetical protein